MDQRAKAPVTLPQSTPTKSYWQDPPDEIADLRTTEDLPDHADVVIIGSGITGAAVAWELLQEQQSLDDAEKKSMVMLRLVKPAPAQLDATVRSPPRPTIPPHVRPNLSSQAGTQKQHPTAPSSTTLRDSGQKPLFRSPVSSSPTSKPSTPLRASTTSTVTSTPATPST